MPFVPEIVHPDGPAGSSGRAATALATMIDARTPTTMAARRHRSLVGAAGLHHPVDLLDDLGVGERGDVAEGSATRHVSEQPAHDLARSRLRKVVGEDQAVWSRDLADLVSDVLPELGRDGVVAFVLALQRDECDDRLAVDVVGPRDDGCLGHPRIVTSALSIS